jgi:Nucleoside-diphosphate-sugar pyrophosphorylase involved in lipopolysaccharide biosynthesis/translation initiation factor 2B, gamma/epsilon subunits (eIF-2Bgamma/eIF-2Bepsilon)
LEKVLVVLAAGRGERLAPLTETRPKPLLPVLGESLVCRHLRLALSTGSYDRVIVVVSYMGSVISRAVSSCGFNVDLVDQGGEFGTGHAVFKAMEYGGPGLYTIVYSDLYMSPEVYSLIELLGSPGVLATTTSRPWDYGVLVIEGGVLKGVVEKPSGPPPSNLVFAGVLRLDYDFIEYFKSLKPSPRGELEATDALSMIALDHRVDVRVAPEGSWLDVGRPWDLLLASRDALDRELKPLIKGDVHPTSVIEGRVFVEEGARIGAYTVIEGPAYIGRGAVVGPHAHIRPYTVILDGAHIGAFTQVKASILMEHSNAPHLNYVGDSIVGEHVNLGAGTITANFRFDEATVKVTVKGSRVDSGLRKLGAIIGGYVKTGINVSILPGVKIGSRAWIWPGCVVNRDVGSGERFNCWAL